MNLFSKVVDTAGFARDWLISAWIRSELNPTPKAPPGVEAKIQTVLNWLMWIAGAAVIVGFIVGGLMLAVSNERGMGNDNVRRIGYVILGAIVIAASSALAKALL
ncbi:MAG: hypothetical protein Q4D87_01420 [Actinomycetaceae bacterium]|nr:hypothetical protein [Actinomycetaceae bacterium]